MFTLKVVNCLKSNAIDIHPNILLQLSSIQSLPELLRFSTISYFDGDVEDFVLLDLESWKEFLSQNKKRIKIKRNLNYELNLNGYASADIADNFNGNNLNIGNGTLNDHNSNSDISEGLIDSNIITSIPSISSIVFDSRDYECRCRIVWFPIPGNIPPIGSSLVSINGLKVTGLDRDFQLALLKQRKRPILMAFSPPSSEQNAKTIDLPSRNVDDSMMNLTDDDAGSKVDNFSTSSPLNSQDACITSPSDNSSNQDEVSTNTSGIHNNDTKESYGVTDDKLEMPSDSNALGHQSHLEVDDGIIGDNNQQSSQSNRCVWTNEDEVIDNNGAGSDLTKEFMEQIICDESTEYDRQYLYDIDLSNDSPTDTANALSDQTCQMNNDKINTNDDSSKTNEQNTFVETVSKVNDDCNLSTNKNSVLYSTLMPSILTINSSSATSLFSTGSNFIENLFLPSPVRSDNEQVAGMNFKLHLLHKTLFLCE